MWHPDKEKLLRVRLCNHEDDVETPDEADPAGQDAADDADERAAADDAGEPVAADDAGEPAAADDADEPVAADDAEGAETFPAAS